MRIKEFQLEEWKELRDLYLALLQSDPDAFVDEHTDIASRTEADWIKTLQRKGKTFVAVDNGRFVGMGRINLYDELPGVPVLHKLGVLPEYRGKGIGKMLVEAREGWAAAEGAKKVRLYVVLENKQAVTFAEKNGYTITETLIGNSQKKDGTKVDVVVMEKCFT